MSTRENDIWLESACEMWEEAMMSGNISLANDIKQDMVDKGFSKEANQLVAEDMALHDLWYEHTNSKHATKLA